MKVLLLSRYGSLGASSRLRMYQYGPYLQANGVELTISPLLDEDYLRTLYRQRSRQVSTLARSYMQRLLQLIRFNNYDLIWLEKELFPGLPAWGEQLLARLSVPCIIDYDDAIFHYYDQHTNPAIRRWLHDKIDRAMHFADAVIVGNEYLARRARQQSSNVHLIPTVIDLNRYPLPRPIDNEVFTVGWIGSPATTPYLREVLPVFKRLRQCMALRIVLVGAGDFQLDDLPVEILPWNEETEVSHIQSLDVGIMPLPNNPWERGKCGYKLIQYMACGRPVVGSPVGVNTAIIEHGTNGFLARTTAEWCEALSQLHADAKLRTAMGQAGRKKVEQQYCMQVTAPMLLSIFRDTIEGGVKCVA